MLCIINVDGAWLDGIERKVKAPEQDMQHLMQKITKTLEYKVI